MPVQDDPKHLIFDDRIALYNVTSWSLPANHWFVSLLRALSSRLAGRLLVTTITSCSDYLRLVPRRFSPSSGTLDPETWQTLDTSTHFCSVMMPLAWRQMDSDREVMRMLFRILDNFSVLVRWASLLLTPFQSVSLRIWRQQFQQFYREDGIL